MFGFGEKPLLCLKCSWMVLIQFEVVFWIGFEEFLWKGNDEVSKELSKNFKTLFFLAIS